MQRLMFDSLNGIRTFQYKRYHQKSDAVCLFYKVGSAYSAVNDDNLS